jgi:hypothetical protein
LRHGSSGGGGSGGGSGGGGLLIAGDLRRKGTGSKLSVAAGCVGKQLVLLLLLKSGLPAFGWPHVGGAPSRGWLLLLLLLQQR